MASLLWKMRGAKSATVTHFLPRAQWNASEETTRSSLEKKPNQNIKIKKTKKKQPPMLARAGGVTDVARLGRV